VLEALKALSPGCLSTVSAELRKAASVCGTLRAFRTRLIPAHFNSPQSGEIIVLLRQPPMAPELNPIEIVGAYRRCNYLNRRVYQD
jgi:hypothetical protein